MGKLIDEFFYLRKSERRALLIMVLLLLVVISFRVWIHFRQAPPLKIEEEFLAEMLAMQKQLLEEEEKVKQASPGNTYKEADVLLPSPFYFDPNLIPEDSLRMLNLPSFIVQNILKYRKAGGKFYRKSDLGKIYGMDSTLFKTLFPYIKITAIPEEEADDERAGSKEQFSPVELNSADSISLRKIPGIGVSFSRRIIKYRNLLGGYYSKEQLLEVYGMDSARYTLINNSSSLDSLNINTINLNEASYSQLISHPYLDKSNTYAILQYREFRDSIKGIEELILNQILDHDCFRRVAPYLSVK